MVQPQRPSPSPSCGVPLVRGSIGRPSTVPARPAQKVQLLVVCCHPHSRNRQADAAGLVGGWPCEWRLPRGPRQARNATPCGGRRAARAGPRRPTRPAARTRRPTTAAATTHRGSRPSATRAAAPCQRRTLFAAPPGLVRRWIGAATRGAPPVVPHPRDEHGRGARRRDAWQATPRRAWTAAPTARAVSPGDHGMRYGSAVTPDQDQGGGAGRGGAAADGDGATRGTRRGRRLAARGGSPRPRGGQQPPGGTGGGGRGDAVGGPAGAAKTAAARGGRRQGNVRRRRKTLAHPTLDLPVSSVRRTPARPLQANNPRTRRNTPNNYTMTAGTRVLTPAPQRRPTQRKK